MGVPQNGWFIRKNPIKMAASTYGNSQYEPRVYTLTISTYKSISYDEPSY